MLFYNTKEQVILTIDELKKAMYPSTLPRDITEAALAGTPYKIVHKTVPPKTTVIQKVEITGAELIEGKYYTTWKILDKFSGPNKAELEANTLADKQKQADKEQALADLKNESFTAIKDLDALKARLEKLEKYLGI